MRYNTVYHSTFSVTIILVVLFMFILNFKIEQKLFYPIVRYAAEAKVDFQTRNMQAYETTHFVIKYNQEDKDVVAMVAEAAEAAYAPVTAALGYTPKDKNLIIVYHDKQSMNSLSGQLGTEGALGVYWGGVIQVLSPSAWLMGQDNTKDFIHSGPVLHEYTHLVFDHITNGNYPRWFTEGLAQYLEYRVNNYEWLTPRNRLTTDMYSMDELAINFDNLPNQSMAYRESLAAVRYIAQVYGEDKLRGVIAALKQGRTMDKAINDVLGISYNEYAKAWPIWARKNMENYQ